ncbi:hypothetical protein LXT12_26440 [Pelomonas sp. P7]|uniref:Uncharacterized protein n=1 Tax=Pelomonas caseinilytica TaxID=2906763 RepID=A0ABS8XLV8_9BURK|nr:hypothetical protein [Pelomonas sp. P7]MCE4540773.1 hypothetical protein [Pelomonas sp. P7]
MTARYILEQQIFDPHPRLEFTEARFHELVRAGATLSDAQAFEQGYELMLGNFMDMELAFSRIGLSATLEFDHHYGSLAQILRDANRQVVNVLTAIRSYVDQAPQLFKALDLTPDFASAVRKALNDMHANSADYRFVYALRNHVQHQGSAVQGFEGADDPRVDANGWADAVRLLAFKNQLGTADFKASVLAEQPDRIDVRQRLRMSMEALGTVHLALRELVVSRVDAARSAFEEAIRDYQAAKPPGVAALYLRSTADPTQAVLIGLDWDDVRLSLVRKNSQPARLWPRRSRGQPEPSAIVALRVAAEHSVRQAAGAVCVSEVQWMDWEAGLPMPEGLFILYQLQTGQHPTHRVERKPDQRLTLPS